MLQEWFDKWTSVSTPTGKFNKAITQLVQHKQRVFRKLPVYRSCDLCAMATVVRGDIVMETQSVYATVELHGTYTRGMMVVDWREDLGKEPNVTLVKRVDTEKAGVLFDEMLLK